MQSSAAHLYQQIGFVFIGIQVLISLGIFALMLIGWRRHQQTGFLVLLAWSLAALAIPLAHLFGMQLGLTLARKLIPQMDQFVFMIVTNGLGSLVSSLLLCVGLAMLVFAAPRPR
jgi:hypothetical protein